MFVANVWILIVNKSVNFAKRLYQFFYHITSIITVLNINYVLVWNTHVAPLIWYSMEDKLIAINNINCNIHMNNSWT